MATVVRVTDSAGTPGRASELASLRSLERGWGVAKERGRERERKAEREERERGGGGVERGKEREGGREGGRDK